jgi:CYTH domain-containing protein
MAMETERKFLVNNDSFKSAAIKAVSIEQGYFITTGDSAVRIRIIDNQAVITIKSKNKKNGFSRHEWEYPIPYDDAREIIQICSSNIIKKTRYLIPVEKHCFEVDVFHGENEGLVIAEIELSSEEETFVIPSWLGKEVTFKKKFHNAFIAKKPYSTWKNKQKLTNTYDL